MNVSCNVPPTGLFDDVDLELAAAVRGAERHAQELIQSKVDEGVRVLEVFHAKLSDKLRTLEHKMVLALREHNAAEVERLEKLTGETHGNLMKLDVMRRGLEERADVALSKQGAVLQAHGETLGELGRVVDETIRRAGELEGVVSGVGKALEAHQLDVKGQFEAHRSYVKGQLEAHQLDVKGQLETFGAALKAAGDRGLSVEKRMEALEDFMRQVMGGSVRLEELKKVSGEVERISRELGGRVGDLGEELKAKIAGLLESQRDWAREEEKRRGRLEAKTGELERGLAESGESTVVLGRGLEETKGRVTVLEAKFEERERERAALEAKVEERRAKKETENREREEEKTARDNEAKDRREEMEVAEEGGEKFFGGVVPHPLMETGGEGFRPHSRQGGRGSSAT